MKEIDTADTRVGTACTFTGKGSREGTRRPRLALIVPGFAAMCLVAIGAGYLMGRPAAPQTIPPPTYARATLPRPAVPAGSPRDAYVSFGAGSTNLPPSGASRSGNGKIGQAPSSPSSHASGGALRAVAAGERPRGAAARASRAAGGVPALPRFHVQAGSFGERDNALSLMARLRDHGYAATLTDGPLYRVWVGGYLDRDTAERLVSNLREEGFDATLAVR